MAREVHRSFTAEQSALIAGVLRPITNANVRVIAVAGDDEAMAFARHMMDVLKKAGWRVDGVSLSTRTGNPFGIHLRTKDPISPTDHTAFTLAEVLKHIGMETSSSSDPTMEVDITEIFIGHRQIK